MDENDSGQGSRSTDLGDFQAACGETEADSGSTTTVRRCQRNPRKDTTDIVGLAQAANILMHSNYAAFNTPEKQVYISGGKTAEVTNYTTFNALTKANSTFEAPQESGDTIWASEESEHGAFNALRESGAANASDDSDSTADGIIVEVEESDSAADDIIVESEEPGSVVDSMIVEALEDSDYSAESMIVEALEESNYTADSMIFDVPEESNHTDLGVNGQVSGGVVEALEKTDYTAFDGLIEAKNPRLDQSRMSNSAITDIYRVPDDIIIHIRGPDNILVDAENGTTTNAIVGPDGAESNTGGELDSARDGPIKSIDVLDQTGVEVRSGHGVIGANQHSSNLSTKIDLKQLLEGWSWVFQRK